MYEQFVELTNQIFWQGYAEQLAQENPAQFQMELSDFLNTYQYQGDGRQNFSIGESDY